jgi:hypothetical protein
MHSISAHLSACLWCSLPLYNLWLRELVHKLIFAFPGAKGTCNMGWGAYTNQFSNRSRPSSLILQDLLQSPYLLSFVKGMFGTHVQPLDPTDIIHRH